MQYPGGPLFHEIRPRASAPAGSRSDKRPRPVRPFTDRGTPVQIGCFIDHELAARNAAGLVKAGSAKSANGAASCSCGTRPPCGTDGPPGYLGASQNTSCARGAKPCRLELTSNPVAHARSEERRVGKECR